MKLELAVVSILLIPSVVIPIAAANSHLGIELSQTCLTLHKNNQTTDCPNYEQVLLLFPDTSDQRISGEFDYSENIYQRQPSKFKNHFNFYEFGSGDVRWVDPPGDVRTKIAKVIITSTDFEYKIPYQTITNGSVQVGQSRYVSPACDEAIITAKNWVFLLGDTLQLMQNDCDPAFTNFDEVKIKRWETTKHSIADSAKYKLEQWQKEAIERCGKTICKNEKTKHNPEGAR